MKSLGYLKEVVAASDHIPLGGDLQFGKQWHQAVKHLGDAASHSSRVHHLDRLTLEITRQEPQRIQVRLANDAFVVI